MRRRVQIIAVALLALLLVAADGAPPALDFQITAVAVVVAVTGALRRIGVLAGDHVGYAGLVALTVGLLFGLGWEAWGDGGLGGAFNAAFRGFLAGASASGLVSSVKNAAERLTADAA